MSKRTLQVPAASRFLHFNGAPFPIPEESRAA